MDLEKVYITARFGHRFRHRFVYKETSYFWQDIIYSNGKRAEEPNIPGISAEQGLDCNDVRYKILVLE